MPETIEVRTRWSWVLIRLITGALCLAAPPIAARSGGIEGAGDALAAALGVAFGVFLLTHRVRERAILDARGITLTYAPLSVGPFPLIQREVFASWHGVSAVEEVSPPGLWPLTAYRVHLATERRARVKWALGAFFVTSHREALDAIVRRSRRGAVDAETYLKVRGWRQRGAV